MRQSTWGFVRRAILFVLFVGVTVYSLFPLYWMLISGLRAEHALFEPILRPGPYALQAYKTILSLTDFPTYYVNSILVAVGTTLLTIAVVTPMAYALVRSRLPGMMLVVRAMLFAYMFPALLLAIPIYIFLVKIGWDNALSSLMLTYCSFTLPLGVWLMWGFFKSFPFEVEEAALVDGCSRLQAIYRIILPITLPGVLTVAIFAFLLAWSDFVFSLVLITSDDLKTLPYGLASMDDAYDANWGELMAGSTMIVLPLLMLFVFLGKYFIRGLSMGAVKS
jgi:ABC-type glycerol-3-phosphate transport system permease component